MEAKAVDFVQYTVSDLSESLPFYRDTLGLDVERHVEEYGWAELALPPTTLALHEAESDDLGEPDEGDAAIALAVDDVEEAVAELREEGRTVIQEPLDTGVCDMATVTDPDGNAIVLHRRHDGTHGRKDPFP